MSPLAIDLFCGLGGWCEGLQAEGWDVIGFDIERHVYGEQKYPGLLAIQDVLTLDGKQFKSADLIVASPPCQEYSYMAMPWSRAKAIAAEYRSGKRDVKDLTRLFDACFRIQREACEAAGRHIPLVVENVRGAIPWVGRSRWNFGSFHLWGDVPALMPMTVKGTKVGGITFSGYGTPGYKAVAFNGTAEKRLTEAGLKVPGFRFDETASVEGMKAPAGTRWFNDGPRTPDSLASSGSKSPARKAASAMIAKIPLPLSRHIGAAFRPRQEAA